MPLSWCFTYDVGNYTTPHFDSVRVDEEGGIECLSSMVLFPYVAITYNPLPEMSGASAAMMLYGDERRNVLLWDVVYCDGSPVERCRHCPSQMLNFRRRGKPEVGGVAVADLVLPVADLPRCVDPATLFRPGELAAGAETREEATQVDDETIHMVASRAGAQDPHAEHHGAAVFGSLPFSGRQQFSLILGCKSFFHQRRRFRVRVQLVVLDRHGQVVFTELAASPEMRVVTRFKRTGRATATPPVECSAPTYSFCHFRPQGSAASRTQGGQRNGPRFVLNATAPGAPPQEVLEEEYSDGSEEAVDDRAQTAPQPVAEQWNGRRWAGPGHDFTGVTTQDLSNYVQRAYPTQQQHPPAASLPAQPQVERKYNPHTASQQSHASAHHRLAYRDPQLYDDSASYMPSPDICPPTPDAFDKYDNTSAASSVPSISSSGPSPHMGLAELTADLNMMLGLLPMGATTNPEGLGLGLPRQDSLTRLHGPPYVDTSSRSMPELDMDGYSGKTYGHYMPGGGQYMTQQHPPQHMQQVAAASRDVRYRGPPSGTDYELPTRMPASQAAAQPPQARGVPSSLNDVLGGYMQDPLPTEPSRRRVTPQYEDLAAAAAPAASGMAPPRRTLMPPADAYRRKMPGSAGGGGGAGGYSNSSSSILLHQQQMHQMQQQQQQQMPVDDPAAAVAAYTANGAAGVELDLPAEDGEEDPAQRLAKYKRAHSSNLLKNGITLVRPIPPIVVAMEFDGTTGETRQLTTRLRDFPQRREVYKKRVVLSVQVELPVDPNRGGLNAVLVYTMKGPGAAIEEEAANGNCQERHEYHDCDMIEVHMVHAQSFTPASVAYSDLGCRTCGVRWLEPLT